MMIHEVSGYGAVIDILGASWVSALIAAPWLRYLAIGCGWRAVLHEVGVWYVEACYQGIKHRYRRSLLIVCTWVMIAVGMYYTGIAICIWLAIMAWTGDRAIRRGHVPGTVEW